MHISIFEERGSESKLSAFIMHTVCCTAVIFLFYFPTYSVFFICSLSLSYLFPVCLFVSIMIKKAQISLYILCSTY